MGLQIQTDQRYKGHLLLSPQHRPWSGHDISKLFEWASWSPTPTDLAPRIGSLVTDSAAGVGALVWFIWNWEYVVVCAAYQQEEEKVVRELHYGDSVADKRGFFGTWGRLSLFRNTVITPLGLSMDTLYQKLLSIVESSFKCMASLMMCKEKKNYLTTWISIKARNIRTPIILESYKIDEKL